ncbi:MAG TPA: Asp-tRNA(Asn)/Glu-tRNA(Gln) amidotransferase subunit GatC [Virgibacillus sp.]|nr:Asp-tRNA(Asn)/Glu-tRNA(Gln) amidotransferase subunit GatC [Virgibacillus sp.]
MAKVTKAEVENIADLVRIAVSDKEVESYTAHLNTVIEYADKLSELNTDDVEPTKHGIVLENVLRTDEVTQSITQEEALRNAPDKQDGHFKVPSVME